MATTETPSSESTKGAVGRVEEIQGVVLEATFNEGELPEIYNALEIDRGGDDGILVCEVQQHLGDDRVRAVAMDTTDGLARGAEVVDTGGPITVPVGRGRWGASSTCSASRSTSSVRSSSPSAGRSTVPRRTSRT